MSQSGYRERSLQPAIHPLDFYDDHLVSSRHTVITKGLIVEHQFQRPGEYSVSEGMSHHVLPFRLNQTDHQISRVGEREYSGKYLPGEFLFCPAYTSGFSQADTVNEAIVFIAEPAGLQQISAETNCLNSHQIELIGTPKTRDSQIQAIATLFLNEIQTGGLGGLIYAESLANLFLIHLLRHYCTFEPKLKQYQGGLPAYKLRQAIDYIQAHLDDKLTLEAIAQELNMSVYHFCDLFKQSVGIAPYKYVLQQRVERAKLLLKDEERAIVDIALECGFANQTHLNKHFRSFTGITPKTYRDGW
jgi:AraC family transcriptional regulator